MKRLHIPLLAVLLPAMASAGVVWRGDFETGTIGQFSGAQRVSADRLQVVQSRWREGKYALKATVRQGDDPINSSGNRNELVYQGPEKEGSEYYYRWKVLFASDFPSVKTWQVFTQWHHDGQRRLAARGVLRLWRGDPPDAHRQRDAVEHAARARGVAGLHLPREVVVGPVRGLTWSCGTTASWCCSQLQARQRCTRARAST